MKRSHKFLMILLLVAAASMVVAVWLLLTHPRRVEQEVNLEFSLYNYCYEHTTDEQSRHTACSTWGSEFTQQHQDIIRQCIDLAGSALDDLSPFVACMDQAGAQAYLPSE